MNELSYIKKQSSIIINKALDTISQEGDGAE